MPCLCSGKLFYKKPDKKQIISAPHCGRFEKETGIRTNKVAGKQEKCINQFYIMHVVAIFPNLLWRLTHKIKKKRRKKEVSTCDLSSTILFLGGKKLQ